MRRTRVIAATAIVALAVLVACVVALAVSSSSPTAIVPAHLEVGPGTPTTATGVLTFSGQAGLSAQATCTFDFARHAADIDASATLSIATISLEARLLRTVLLLDTSSFGSLTGTPWVAVRAPHGPGALDALANELRHPDLARLHADTRSVTTSHHDTTTTLTFRSVTLPSTQGLPITLPSEGRLVVSLTTGSQGQLLEVGARLRSRDADDYASFVITGYNQPVTIQSPTPSDVSVLTPRRTHEIFGTNAPAVLRWLARLHLTPGT